MRKSHLNFGGKFEFSEVLVILLQLFKDDNWSYLLNVNNLYNSHKSVGKTYARPSFFQEDLSEEEFSETGVMIEYDIHEEFGDQEIDLDQEDSLNDLEKENLIPVQVIKFLFCLSKSWSVDLENRSYPYLVQ